MEAVRAAAAPTTFRTVLSDYFEMTKPKVQSLLLFTTVTTMYVAGDPSLGLTLQLSRVPAPTSATARGRTEAVAA